MYSSNMIDLKHDFPEAAVSVHILAQLKLQLQLIDLIYFR